ncbi:MAG: ATP-binding cassette domain-containing protein, partial [Anaerolineaceae bacterium]|nr:ATP-binding cassette domain-containing protein [Anaerolineaceae bacterium]
MIQYEIMSLERVTLNVNGQIVLNDISFRLFEDKVTFLVGNPHGGKTMLTRILSGEIDSYQGRIILDGKPYKPASAKRRQCSKIYTISDYCPLMEDMSIAENIGLARPPFSIALNYKKRLST